MKRAGAPRVVLRAPGEADRAEFVRRAKESLGLHRTWVAPPRSLPAYDVWLKQVTQEKTRAFLVRRGDGGGLAGAFVLSAIVRGNFRSAYLGYYAFAASAAEGTMREGLRLLLVRAFGRLGLERIEANVQPGNGRSIAFIRAAGFAREGFSPAYLRVAGRRRDHERWAIHKQGSSRAAAAGPPLGPRFEDALAFAARLHARQLRKGTSMPYVSHLLAVAALVIEEGADEDQAIAALLHDAAEDQGGRPTLLAIRERFGERVAALVEACTDSWERPKPPWRPRKEAYIKHLASAPPEVLRIASADKLHNARAILADYLRHGERVWERFQGGREGTLWYYREVARTLAGRGPSALVEELERVVQELERLAGGV